MNIKRYFFISALCWSLLIFSSMAYEIYRARQDSDKRAMLEAQIALTKDFLYRKWVISKGGIYAPVAKNTPPNPYLQVPEQNIVTPAGKELTLVNPAYMIRQVYEMEREAKGILSHITSLDPIRPQNKADNWEEKVLRKFETGTKEYSEYLDIEGRSYLRYMKVFTAKQGCLKCHAFQGYKEGDVRGGISIAIPMAAIHEMERASIIHGMSVLLLLWLLGLGGLSYGSYHLQKQLTKRKETETELQKFKQTLDQTNDCVFMFAPDTLRFFYVNQGALDLLGYLEEEFLNMTSLDIMPLYTEQSFLEFVKPLRAKSGSSVTFESTHRHKDGHDIPVEIHLQYVVLGEEQSRFVAVVRDISRRKQAELEKEMLQAQILHSQKLESVGQLAAGIAHEINTPAQFLGMNIDFLDKSSEDVKALIEKYQSLAQEVRDGKVNPERLASLERCVEDLDWDYLAEEIPVAIKESREGVECIAKIVHAMKEFSHPGSKEKAPVNINKIINTTITVASNEWKSVAELETDLAENLPHVTCLADEMGQVFLNILINAAHSIGDKLATLPEGEKGLINITSRQDGEWIEVCIKDNGKGMPDSIREHVFEPFFTTKEVGKGTGQGLAIAYSVITDKHQGSLTCESEEGVGASFIIRLPLVT